VTLQEGFDFLNFWINKSTGAWYTISELEAVVDRGQMSLYSDIQPKYATSQHIKDALAPFRDFYNFTTLVSGFVIVPANQNYLNLLDLRIYFNISDVTRYYSVPMTNEDELSDRLNSQIDPVTITSPVGEQTAPGSFRLYPANAYNGTVRFLRRPVKPVFAYTTISERVIVFDEANSTNLEWTEEWYNAVLLKALSSIGINLTSQEISNYAEMKTQSNFQNINRV
jgi:hypothetical protein